MAEDKQEKKNALVKTLSVLSSSKTAMIGLIIVLFWVFVAVSAPWLTRYTPMEQDWKISKLLLDSL